MVKAVEEMNSPNGLYKIEPPTLYLFEQGQFFTGTLQKHHFDGSFSILLAPTSLPILRHEDLQNVHS